MDFDHINFSSVAEQNEFYGIDSSEYVESQHQYYDNLFNEIAMTEDHEANAAS